MTRKRYYPNKWQEYKDADDSMFVTHTFEELMHWKVANWELPSSIACIVRTTNLNTKQVREKVFETRKDAQKVINALIRAPDIEFIVCDNEAIHSITPP